MAAAVSTTKNAVRRKVHDALVRTLPDEQNNLVDRLTTAIYDILTGAVTIPVTSTTSVKEGSGIDVTDGGDGAVTVAVDSSVARRNADNTFTPGSQQVFQLSDVIGVPDAPTVKASGAVGTSVVEGFHLENDSAAASGAGNQKWSPSLKWTGHGWRTASGGASEDVEWHALATAASGTNHPTTALIIGSSVNGTDIVPRLTIAGGASEDENNPGTVTAGIFSGSGASLTSLNATSISSGTLSNDRLSANVPLKNASNTFTSANTFQTGIDLDGSDIVDCGVVKAGNVTYHVLESGTSKTMVSRERYQNTNAALCTFTLPGTAAVGERMEIVGVGTGLWKIAQNASQIIHFGATSTTTGVGGSISASHRRDCIAIECVVANLEWVVVSSVGANFTVV